MNALRGVKLAIPIPAFVAALTEIVETDGADAKLSDETLGRLAANYNAKEPQVIKFDGGQAARLVRVYAREGALYGDLDNAPPALMEQLRILKQTGATLAVTLHFDEGEEGA